MRKTKKGFKKIIVSATIFTILVAVFFALNAIPQDGKNESLVFQKIGTNSAYIPSITEDFADDRVIVTLKQKYSEINGKVSLEDFGIGESGIELSDIKDMFYIEKPEENKLINQHEFFQILSLQLKTKGKDKVLEAIHELQKSEIVLAAEPDYNHKMITTSVGTTYDQWALNGENGINASEAWGIATGSKAVRVGIMEAGFDAGHDDLKENVLTLPGGYTPAPYIDITHGTHVAGIVGALSDNNKGIAGIAQVSLVQIDWSNLLTSLQFAANNDIWIVNASFGYTDLFETAYSPAKISHAAAIYNYQGLLICAAGNGLVNYGRRTAQNTDEVPCYPAGYSNYTIEATQDQPARPITNVISVGATDQAGERWEKSNYGENSVQIYAPGKDIVSAYPTSVCDKGLKQCQANGTKHVAYGYHLDAGTSMAAPHVTGVAALLLSAVSGSNSVYNHLTQGERTQLIKSALLEHADTVTISIPNGRNTIDQTVKKLNAYNAVSSIAFQTNETGNVITGINFDPTGKLTVPEEIRGVAVTGIGEQAFKDCRMVEKITLPCNVTSIGRYAFQNCSSLERISIPMNAENIGSNAFDGCSALTGVELPTGIGNIATKLFYNCKALTEVTIPAGVNRIGDNAFSGCSNLQEVTFLQGSSLTEIGRYAFGGCSGLGAIQIPSGVTKIADSAFSGCSSLQNFVIPSSVTSIGRYAFVGCSGLETIQIPSGVTEIADSAFSGCSGLGGVTIPQGVTNIGNGAFSDCSGLERLVLPGSVKRIGQSAFSGCSRLSSITVPDGVTEIGDSAFRSCTSLTGIVIPSGVTWIGERTFAWCSSLVYVAFGTGSRLAGIGEEAFYHCTGLMEIAVPGGVTEIGSSAFAGASGLTRITLPFVGNTPHSASNRYFGYIFGAPDTRNQNLFLPASLRVVVVTEDSEIPYKAFYNCSALRQIVIASGTAIIGESALKGCRGLEGADFLAGSRLTSIGAEAFDGCSRLTSIVLPNSVQDIGQYAFRGCSSLRSASIGTDSRLIHIGNHAFDGCGQLAAIDIPGGITSIGEGTFRNCHRLADVTFASGIVLTGIGRNAFYGCSDLADIIIPDGVTELASYAFYGCRSLVRILLPGTVSEIGEYAFYGCSNLADITIPDGITEIAGYTFHGCSGLTSIVLPDTVLRIGKYVFSGCSGLSRITIPAGVAEIGDFAFNDCGLTHLVIPAHVTDIGLGAFSNCVNLTAISVEIGNQDYFSENGVLYNRAKTKIISFPIGKSGSFIIQEGVTCIADYAFYACKNLTDIQMPGSLENIGNYAFYACKSLSEIVLPSSTALVGDYAFYGCNGLLRIDICEGVAGIGNYAFYRCTRLSELVIPESMTEIGDYAFYGCNGLLRIDISEGVAGIGNFTFYGCTRLSELVIPESMTKIGNHAFAYCGLQEVYIPSNVTEMGSYAFSYCVNLSIVVFGTDSCLTDINGFIFYECTALEQITIPSGVERIGDYAFGRCTNLTNVAFESEHRLLCIQSNAFYFCESLRSITFPDSIQSIGIQAFAFSGIRSITLPAAMKTVGKNAFAWCEDLTVVYIEKVFAQGGTVTFDGNVHDGDAFEDCENLKLIVFPDSETLFEYKYYILPGYDDILHCVGLRTVVVTVMNGVDMDGSFPFHRFGTIYDIREIYSSGFDEQCREKGVIFYIPRTPNWRDMIQLFDYMIRDCYDENISCTVVSAVEFVQDVPVVGRDWYSKGFNIAVEYMDALAKKYEQSADEMLDFVGMIGDCKGFFPIIAPEYYAYDLCFLRGISDALNVPVKLLSGLRDTLYESEEINFLTGLNFQDWLFVDIEYGDISAQLQYIERDLIDPANFYFFASDLEKLVGMQSISDHVYLVADKVDYIGSIALGFEEEIEIYYSDWTFDAQTRWFEKNYPQRYAESEWTEYWESLGYSFDYEKWQYLWDSYFTDHPIYLVEQIVILL